MKSVSVKTIMWIVTEYNVRVFPLAEKSKKPVVKWRKTFSTGVESFENFQKNYPKANWGINCGRSNLTVIDVDVKKGKRGKESLAELEELLGKLPDTLVIKTPTGGFHIYFYGRCKTSADHIGPGIDVRSEGGFVVAPGCYVIDKEEGIDGAYTIFKKFPIAQIPEAWADACNTPGEKDPNREISMVELDSANSISWATDYLNEEAEISVAHEGGDNNAYKVACAVRDFGVSEYVTAHLMASFWNERCKPPWSTEELDTFARNAHQYSQEAAGSKSPEADFEEIKPTAEELASLPGALMPEEKEELDEKELGKYDYSSLMYRADEFDAVHFPEKKTLLDPWIQESSIILLTGDPGVGKTWFAMAICYAIATGWNFGPWDTRKQVPVCYFEAEMAGVDQQERLRQLRHGSSQPDNFFYLSGAAIQQNSLAKPILSDKEVRRGITNALVKYGVKFWVLDNLSSTTPGMDENEKKAYDEVNQWLLDLRHIGITTMVVHHHNKAGGQRGTSGKEDNIDLNVVLRRPKGYQADDGARFEVVFKKSRQFKQSQLRRMVGQEFQLLEGTYADWSWKKQKKDKYLEAMIMLAEGYKNKYISEELNMSPSNVTKALKKGKEKGYFDRKGDVTYEGSVYFEDCLIEEDPMFK